MKSVFNALYVAIFLQFVRKIVDKVSFSVCDGISVTRRDDSNNYYVKVCGNPVVWFDDQDEAVGFCLTAFAACRSLVGKLRIEENGEDMDLVAVDTIPGLTEDEILSVNECIENLE